VLHIDRLPDAVGTGIDHLLDSSGILLIVLLAGLAAGSRGARSWLVWIGLAVGALAVLLTQVLPGDLGFLGDALRYEVPKTVQYWLSGIAAAGAAPALAAIWSSRDVVVPWLGRVAAVTAFVVVAALPWRPGEEGAAGDTDTWTINAAHLGEHRWSETFAIDLRFADSGYWRGFPDSRHVVDAPRQELLDAVRVEIDAGRLRHDTPVLHAASSFQQWVATPLGVFDGVFETVVSLDPERSHHTVGGRLLGVKDDPAATLEVLRALLATRAYPYVVLEPAGFPDEARAAVLAAGYEPIFANDQGEVFALDR
jgi:hypothetical protein